MKTQKMQIPAVVLVVCLLFAPWVFVAPAHAQTTTGSIYGTVSDTMGAVISNASVATKNVQTGESRAVQTNASGDYVFSALQPGNYEVSVRARGFKTLTQTKIVVDANQNVHVIFTMPTGTSVETVSVTAGTTLVDTLESQLGSTVDQKRLQELPLNGRNAYDLAQLSPGITGFSEAQNSNNVGDVSGVTFSTNGLPVYNNSFYLDGANNVSFFRPGGNYPPNPDALQEFRILTSNFDAEFGTMPGAVVNMITRSGANRFHGLAYDYVRNTLFNARTEFQNGPATHLRQNQFGGNFGGPLYHDKLFFFFSYQGLRIATNSVVNAGAATVPTAAERIGGLLG